jgi:starvation-inducible DNA-binding protein
MNKKKVIDGLVAAVADSMVLYIKTQNYHWNVTGPHFKSLHLMFEEQYSDLSSAIDLLAERVRAMGAKVPATYAKYAELTHLEEGHEDLPAEKMIAELLRDQHIIVKTFSNVLKSAQEIGDEVTATIVTDRIEIHQKNAWMLESSLA